MPPSPNAPIRSFIPAKDWSTSRQFYQDLGAQETWVAEDNRLALYNWGPNAFYIQNAYVKAWAEDTMFYLTVEDVDQWWAHLSSLELPQRYGVKIWAPFQTNWGSYEIHMHDPAGVLWYFGKFD